MLAAAVLAATAALAVVGAASASNTPDSQGALCRRGLEEMTAGDDDLRGVYRVGRLHPILLGGVSQRPDEFVLERHRRLAMLESAVGSAAKECPDFSPFLGRLHGHLLVGVQAADWRNR